MQKEKGGRTETLRKESKNHLWAQGGLQCCISIQLQIYQWCCVLLNFFPIYELVGTICGSISKINSDCVTAPTSEESPGSVHRHRLLQSAQSSMRFGLWGSVLLVRFGHCSPLVVCKNHELLSSTYIIVNSKYRQTTFHSC